MIYIGNGMYSDANPNEYLEHYGVLGMKWGIHRARIHEKNLYRYNRANGMSRQDAKAQYRSRMAGVKSYARKNLRTGMKARDIATNSYNKANKTIADYDKLRKNQKARKIFGAALGAAAAGAAGYGIYKYTKGKKNMGAAQQNFKDSAKYAKQFTYAYDAMNRRTGDAAEKAARVARRAYANTHSLSAEGISNTYSGLRNKGAGKRALGVAAGLGAAGIAALAASNMDRKKAFRKKRED
jgi:hypothetical protein